MFTCSEQHQRQCSFFFLSNDNLISCYAATSHHKQTTDGYSRGTADMCQSWTSPSSRVSAAGKFSQGQGNSERTVRATWYTCPSSNWHSCLRHTKKKKRIKWRTPPHHPELESSLLPQFRRPGQIVRAWRGRGASQASSRLADLITGRGRLFRSPAAASIAISPIWKLFPDMRSSGTCKVMVWEKNKIKLHLKDLRTFSKGSVLSFPTAISDQHIITYCLR